ncbi:hypothetical protein OSB04_031410 [Centaurea solstitialis]|uniref:Uncharacterized protein n=1 Tax=Centaurea solstitialis TaxID=347529 RepID=A0AA38SSZ3_9ASTR|nr:hypothetical protein OSB04_031410 [Centaurea solstitialis]
MQISSLKHLMWGDLIINKELTVAPISTEVYVRNDPTGKMFSNMKRVSISKITPLFSTMIGVIPTLGEASGLQPTQSSTPTTDLTPPITQNSPQSPIHKTPSPSLKIYKRKTKGVPSSYGSKKPKPKSPIVEHSPLENFQRETHGVSPNSHVKEVPSKEQDGHVDGVAYTTVVAQGAYQNSVNISKTPSTATQDEKSSRGLGCQETKGVDSVFARQKASTKISKDPVKKVHTSKFGEDRYNYDELMEIIGQLSFDQTALAKSVQEHAAKFTTQEGLMDLMEKLIQAQNAKIDARDVLLFDLKRKLQFQGARIPAQNAQISALKKKYSTLAAFTKGEKSGVKGEKKMKKIVKAAVLTKEKVLKEADTDERKDQVKGEPKKKISATTVPEKEAIVNEEERVAVETLVDMPQAAPKVVVETKGVVIKEGQKKSSPKKKILDAKDKGKSILIEEPKKKVPKRIPNEMVDELSLKTI